MAKMERLNLQHYLRLFAIHTCNTSMFSFQLLIFYYNDPVIVISLNSIIDIHGYNRHML